MCTLFALLLVNFVLLNVKVKVQALKTLLKTKAANATKLFALSALCIALSACNSDSTSTTTDGETVSNSAPTVDAGIDQTVNAGDTVYLSSTVEDDGEVSVSWSQTSGTTVSLSSSTAMSTEFVAPEVLTDEALVFEISADDGTNDVVVDTVIVNVIASSDSDTVDNSAKFTSWLINNDTTSTYIQNNSAVVEDVQSVEVVTVAQDDADVESLWVYSPPLAA